MKLKTILGMVLSLPLFAVAAPKPVTQIKVLTWNVYMVPKPLKFSMQGDRTTLIAQKLSQVDHDIIILEQAYSGSFRKTITKALASSHPYVADLPRDGKWKHFTGSGLMALSKYPMRIIAKDYYKSCLKADCFAAKGIMTMEVEIPNNRKLHVSATHMNGLASQVDQIKALHETIHNEETPSIPLVLVGTLNVNGHGSDFAPTIADLNMDSTSLLNPEVQSSDLTTCYKKGSVTTKWVDHILLDPRKTKTEVQGKKVVAFYGKLKGSDCALSDHQGVEATLKIYE